MNKYHDKKGHFTNKENNNGECDHDYGGIEDFDTEYNDLNKLEEDECDKIYGDLELFSTYEWKLNRNEKVAIQKYTNESIDYNTYLRNKRMDDENINDTIDALSKAIDRFELKDNLKVFRISDDLLIRNKKVGDIVEDKAFISTTPIKSALYDYKEKWGGGKDYNYEILIPKGKGRGAYIAPYSHFGYTEEEFLLQKNSKFKILDIDGKNVKLELVVD